MKKSPDFTYVYARAVKYLSIRPRSTKELSDYFEKKEFDAEISTEVIDQLTREKFLDDEEFARWWIRGRQAQGKASFVIKRELEQKGLNKGLVERAMQETSQDELSLAKEVVARNHRKYSKYSGHEYRAKMGAFLARRGFSWDIIYKALLHDETE